MLIINTVFCLTFHHFAAQRQTGNNLSVAINKSSVCVSYIFVLHFKPNPQIGSDSSKTHAGDGTTKQRKMVFYPLDDIFIYTHRVMGGFFFLIDQK